MEVNSLTHFRSNLILKTTEEYRYSTVPLWFLFKRGNAENNHEFIRRLLPKGSSFDELTQLNITLMLNHINSYVQTNLGNYSPYEMFQMFYGNEILDILSAVFIAPNHIMLSPEFLK